MTCIDHGSQRSLSAEGYYKISPRGHGFYALHRKVYGDKHGLTAEDLQGVVIRHTCDNGRCINGDHLIEGTQADNNRDRAERDRSAKSRPDKRRLSSEDAEYIRTNMVEGDREFGCKAMARRFNVDRKTIYLIRKGRTYFHEGVN